MDISNKVMIALGCAAVLAILLAGIVLRELAVPSAAQLMDARLLVGLFALFAVFGIVTVASFLRRLIEQNKKLSAAQETLRKFQLAVEHSFEHIIITDPSGRIVYANAAASALTGYAPAEIIGATPALWGKQMQNDFYQRLWTTIAGEKREFFGEITNRRKDGRPYQVEAHIYPLLNASGDPMFFVGIERDITEQKQLESTRSNFISIASHQLRTPLSAMRWIAEILISGDAGALTEAQKELTNDLHHSALRLGALVRGLLNIVRIESSDVAVRPQPVDPAAMCTAVIEEYRSRAQKNDITLACRGTAQIFLTDPVMVREIIRNFLENAFRYTARGGRIALELSGDAEAVTIAVHDTGMGIPREQQGMIFTKFFRADNALRHAADGSGLGLYIARSLAGLLGGTARFISEEGKGSIFSLTLPVTAPAARTGKDLLTGD